MPGCSSFQQVDTIIAVFIDGDGRRLEVIQLDRGHGPRPVIRVSWPNRILIGNGYYQRIEDALKLVDATTLVEVVTHPGTLGPTCSEPTHGSSPPSRR